MDNLENNLRILKMLKTEGASQHNYTETESNIKEFFCEEELVNCVSVYSICRMGWGNKYLLASKCYTKILEWLLPISLAVYYDSIEVVVNNIEDTCRYTYTTLIILLILYTKYNARLMSHLEQKIFMAIEKCVLNIDNYDITVLLLKYSAWKKTAQTVDIYVISNTLPN